MLTPISAHSGYWTPGARLLPTSIRGWWDDLVPNTSSSWADRRGAGPLLGGAGPLGNGARKGRVTATFPGTSGAWLTSVFTNAQPFSVLFACRFGAWGTTAVLMDGVGVMVRVQRQADNQILLAAPTGLTATFSSSLTNRWVVIGATFAGANSSIWENGVLRASGNAGSTNPTGLNLGGPNGGGSMMFTGEIAEVHLMNALTPTQMALDSWFLARGWV